MAITANQKVLTLDYWKPAYKLEVGDWVFDRNGQPVQITMVQEYHAQECYKITLKDHHTLSGDSHLTMPLETPMCRSRQIQYKGHYKYKRQPRYKTTKEVAQTPLQHGKKNGYTLSIPTTKPLALPTQDLPVPPFVFAYWFLRRQNNKMIARTKDCDDIVKQEFKDAGYATKDYYRGFTVSPSIELHLSHNLPNKFPNNYLLSSPEQRLQLLRGIIYARPSRYDVKADVFTITFKDQLLLQQVQFVAESLGLKTRLDYNERDKCCSLVFRSKLQLMHNQRPINFKVNLARRYITKITPIENQLCVHIETTSPDSTILVGEGFIACR